MLKVVARLATHAILSQKASGLALGCRALTVTVPTASSTLLDHIKTKILMRGGPVSIAEYMQDCLTSPSGGFYMTRDVFGSSGDFVTSPEISQLFGEMVGIWCVHTWLSLGRPSKLQLVEMGPGRGTLMVDLLRGTAAFRDFSAALEVHLVEISPALRYLQWAALRCSSSSSSSSPGGSSSSPGRNEAFDLRSLGPGTTTRGGIGQSGTAAPVAGIATSSPPHLHTPSAPEDSSYTVPDRGVSGFNGCTVSWHASLDAVPDGPAPALYIAHEFFDALPVHQFVRDPTRGWLEKMVDVHLDEGSGSGSDTALRPPATTATAAASSPSISQTGSDMSRDGVTITGSSSSDSVSTSSSSSSSSCSNARADSQAPGSISGTGLRLVLSPGPTPATALLVPRRLAGLAPDQAQDLNALEVSAVGMATAERLAHRIGRHGGAALIVDYGREGPPYADSLMAIRAHRGVGILDAPGSADLSAWVDFGALKMAAEGAVAAASTAAASSPPSRPLGPVSTKGPVPQAAFLRALGIETRLQWLASRASDPAAAAALTAGCVRLLSGSEDGGMGMSYQVMAIHQADLAEMAGF